MLDRTNRLNISFIVVSAFVVATLFYLNIYLGPTYGGDIEWYIMAAEGNWDQIIQPYSSRFLHPFTVSLFSFLTGLDIFQSFGVVVIASLFLFFVVVTKILGDNIKNPLLIIPLFFLPYFFDTLRYTFHPDAFYLLLTAFFFLSLYLKSEVWTVILLFLMFLTRESTILLALLFALISWIKNKKILTYSVLIIIAASFFVSSILISGGQPNIHNLNGFTYLFSKLVFNSMTNVLGIIPWANTYNNCAPLINFDLSNIIPLGSIKEVGICGFDYSLPAKSLITLLTIFGVLPFVLLFIYIKKKNEFSVLPFWIKLALLYGVTHYVFGVIAGTSIERLVGYGWPAFILATPILMNKYITNNQNFIFKISSIHIFVAWMPFMIMKIGNNDPKLFLPIVLIIFASYFYLYQILKTSLKNKN